MTVDKKQALEAAAIDAADFMVEDYISRFPTLDADGFPVEEDPFLDAQAEFLLGHSTEDVTE